MVRSNNAEQFGALCGAIQQQYRRNHPDLNAGRGSQVAGARARAARRGRACKAEIYTSGRPAGRGACSAGRRKQFELAVSQHPLLLHNGGRVEN